MNSCSHADTAPVDVRDHTTGGTVTVAHICRHCLTQLPTNWGCPDCEWEEINLRRLCDPHDVIELACRRPCPTHEGA